VDLKGEIMEHDPMAQDKKMAEADAGRLRRDASWVGAGTRRAQVMLQPMRTVPQGAQGPYPRPCDVGIDLASARASRRWSRAITSARSRPRAARSRAT
jgi:hypothetical protein